MGDMRDMSESPTDDAPDAMDETPQVSSLRPANRAFTTFSMRRLLNVASLVVASVLLLALAIHWLPDALPQPKLTPPPNAQATRAQQTITAIRALSHGVGWNPAGPDWATNIVFSADGSVGYTCGAFPGKPFAFFAVYYIAENAWKILPTVPTAPIAVDGCGVSVSPVDSADLLLTIDQCLRCTNGSVPTSLAYRSHDGGATWKALDLPPKTLITDSAWTNRSTLFLAAEGTSSVGTSTPPTFTLLVSRELGGENGPLTEISPHSLGLFGGGIGYLSLISNGMTVFVTGSDHRCTQNCAFIAESSDEGRSWDRDFSNLSIQTINVAAAQYNTSTLIGSTFEQAALKFFVMRSDDGGASWRALPLLPVNPGTGGAVLSISPNGEVYAFCFGGADAVYALQNGASAWQNVASLPLGYPVTVQYDAGGHAVALWAEAHEPNGQETVPGLAYFPLPGNAP